MKTLCIYLIREDASQAATIVDTKFKVTTASRFMELLDEMHECIRTIFALEIYTTQQTTYFCYTADGPTIDVIAGLIYSLIPKAEVVEIPDFTHFADKNSVVATTEIGLVRSEIFPIDTYKELQADTLAPVLAVIARMPPELRTIVQVVVRPRLDDAKLHLWLRIRRSLDRIFQVFRVKYWFKQGFKQTFVQKQLDKTQRKMYHVNFRFGVIAPNVPKEKVAEKKRELRGHLEAIMGGYSILNTPDLISLKMGSPRWGLQALKAFQVRKLSRPYLFATNELTSLWHLPAIGNSPNAAQVLSVKGPAPLGLPTDRTDKELCFFGQTNYRDRHMPFGIYREDRRRHMYVIGKAGSGTSKMLQLLIKADMEQGQGCGVLDPNGDLIDDLLKLVPKNRVKDVVLFDPTDTQFPISFNPLEQVSPALKMRVAVGFVEMFKRRFRAEWSDRLEHLLRYTVLALLSTPGTTILSIRRMLSNADYRKGIVKNIKDQAVRSFWEKEFDTWAAKYADSTIAPLMSKVSDLVASPMIRNIIGQPYNKLNFRELMDAGKIVFMKVQKSSLGDDNASLLGAMLISKIHRDAMSRADIPLRARRDFNLYIDEFHQFADDSFDEILAESRKYRLNLTMANHFLNQLPDLVRKTIFGNVGTLVCFRAGNEDAGPLANELHPRFSPSDLTNLGLKDFLIKTAFRGVTQEPFSGTTLEVTYPETHYAIQCVENSRKNYALPLANAVELVKKFEDAA